MTKLLPALMMLGPFGGFNMSRDDDENKTKKKLLHFQLLVDKLS